MLILKMRRPSEEIGVDDERVILVATFYELVERLGRGDLAGAARRQEELEALGFKVTPRHRPARRKGVANASR